MTTYSSIANAEIDADSPITVPLMTKLRDNPIAITEGASGAPLIQAAALDTDSVTAAAIAANAVAQSEIKTDNSDHDFSVGVDTSVVTSAGAYCLSVTTEPNSLANGNTHHIGRYNRTATDFLSGEFRIWAEVAGDDNCGMRAVFIDASPPYDMGDGEVPLFACLAIEKGSGEIHSVSVSANPVWAHNGPTIITPDGTDGQGRRFRWSDRLAARNLQRRRDTILAAIAGSRLDRETKAQEIEALARAQLSAAALRDHYSPAKQQLRDVRAALAVEERRVLEALDEIKQVNRELQKLQRVITMEDKNADMAAIPHNYTSWDADKYEFAYLDPCETLGLWEMHDAGVFVPTYIREALTIHNDDLSRCVPPGTKAVRFSKR